MSRKTGRKWTEEQRARQSAARVGRSTRGRGWHHSPETLAKIIASNKGQVRSPEICERMRLAALKRAPRSEETKAKIGAAFRGKQLTPSHRAKLSAAAKVRRPPTQAERAKMSASAKAYFATHGHRITPEIAALGRQSRAVSHEMKILKRLCRQFMHRVNTSDSGKRSAMEVTAILGYTPDQLRAHLETRFVEGMTWSNHGSHGWHVDHIRPVAHFVRAGVTDLRIINALSNLQPLWSVANHKKSARYVA